MTRFRTFLIALTRLRDNALVFVGTLVLVLVILMLWQITVLLGALTSAEIKASDNRTWIVAQLVVDYQRLELAVQDAIDRLRKDPAADVLDEVKLRFDVFQSRRVVVTTALEQALSDPRLDPLLASLQVIAEQTSRLVKANGQPDKLRLAQILSLLRTHDALVRKVPNIALEAFSVTTEAARERNSRALNQSTFLIISLFVGLMVTLMLLYSLLIRLRARTLSLETLSANVRTTLDALLDATVVTNAAGVVISMNAAALTMFSLTPLTRVGVRLSDFVQPKDCGVGLAESDEPRAWSVPVVPKGERVRMWARRADGAWFPVEVSSNIANQADGQRMLIYFLRDLTNQDAAEDELRAARDQARIDANTKDRFLAVMSHEMRTPLMGVVASLDLLAGESDPEEQAILIQTARGCSLTSLEQIEDVLELARLGSGSEVAQPFAPVEIAQSIVAQMKPLADQRGNHIQIDSVTPTGALSLLGLPQTYRRVLSNLVGNSVKFTKDGLIRIEIEVTPLSGHSVLLRTAVDDSGIGVPLADQLRVFDEFEVVQHATASTVPGGSGLGLAIVKSGVQRMGGAIMLDSTPGDGSRFWFDITLQTARPEPVPVLFPPAVPVPGRKRRVLVVDDTLANRTVLSRMVGRLGYDVDLAEDGPMAVALAAVKPFDLILMDINLPVIDGLEATRQIRMAGASDAAIIVGITAQILDQHRARMVPSGMDRLIAKPTSIKQLAQCLDEVLAKTPGDQPGPDEPDSRQEVRDLLGDELLGRLVASCLHDTQLALSVWPARIADPIPDTLRDNLHRALGCAAVIGEIGLHAALGQAEEAAQNGHGERLFNLRTLVGHEVEAVRRNLLPHQRPAD